MGLTAGCAECHSHKYDPISHEEYYELFDLFNQTADNDRGDDRPCSTRRPRRSAPSSTSSGWSRGRPRRSGREARRPRRGHRRPRRCWRRERAPQPSTANRRGGPRRRGRDGRGARGRRVAGRVEPRDRGPPRRRPGGACAGHGRIDALAAEGGPGESPGNGNFVLTSLRVGRGPARRPRADGAARPVELPGTQRILSLAEVELIDADGERLDVEVARPSPRRRTAASPGARSTATRAGCTRRGSVTHTATEDDPWWEGRLAAPAAIAGVRLWTRTDGELESRLQASASSSSTAPGRSSARSAPAPAFGPSWREGPPRHRRAAAPRTRRRDPRAGGLRAPSARPSTRAPDIDRDGWAVAGGTGRFSPRCTCSPSGRGRAGWR